MGRKMLLWAGLSASVVGFGSGCQCVAGLTGEDVLLAIASGGGGTGGTTSGIGGSGGSGASCNDGTKNGAESDVDCGGVDCAACDDGKGCTVGPDCKSKVCIGNTCIAPACGDQIKNGPETDVDCGGGCPPCVSGAKCLQSADCKSGVCSEMKCQPTCLDGEENADETGIDCGGPSCPACGPGKGCVIHNDCFSGICKQGVCQDSYVWAAGYGDVVDQNVAALAVDAADNVVLTGFFHGNLDFGNGPLSGMGDYDVFLAKLDKSGSHLWSMRFGDSAAQKGNGVAVDAGGKVAVVGGFQGSIDFGAGSLTSAGDSDVFIAKFNATGGALWSRRFGDANFQTAYSVALDSESSLIAVGGMYGAVNFGGSTLTTAGLADAFVLKLDTDGFWRWNQRWGGSGNDFASSVAVDPSGNVIVAGSFEGTVDFGGGGGGLTSAGGYDIFVVKLDKFGQHQWSRRFGDGSDQFDPRVVADESGNVILAGSFPGTADFGNGPLTSVGDVDVFVAKLDPNGGCVWAKRYGDVNAQSNTRVAVDAAGAVGLTGGLVGILDPGGEQLMSKGGIDVFALKLDAAGNFLWAQSFGDEVGDQNGTAIGFDSESNAFLAGTFTGTVDFSQDGTHTIPSNGNTDIFVAKLLTP